ncbi:MAG TPA: T9SS type A sorting domain-containing protein [Candidatus Kapabacteria bacterium]|nr:T9SS type A sorting domain-containing protein [Candidatus Kapabacteria bacterium]
MIKQLLFFLLVCFLTPIVCSAQDGLFYGDENYQGGYRIKPTRNNGFFIGGWNDRFEKNNSLDYYVLRFDDHGHLLWDSIYGRHPITDFLWSIEPTSDNGALLAGYSGVQFSGAEEALMYKIDSNGAIVTKFTVDYSRADHSHWFKQAPDGNYFWAGHTDSKGDAAGDIIASKLDMNLNVIWEKTYGFAGTGEHAHSAALTDNGGLILAGHTDVNGYEKIYAVKVDASGNELWHKIYGSGDKAGDSPYEVVVTKEGNYAFFGGSSVSGSQSTFWLLVTDTTGKILISQHYGSGYSYSQGGAQTSDSGFIVVGYTALPTDKNYSALVVKTDKEGTVQWQKTFGNADGEAAYGVMQRGSQYLVVGEAPQADGKNNDVWLLVLDENGELTSLDTTLAGVNHPISRSEPDLLAYPNPCADHTIIQYWLPERQNVELIVTGISGEVVKHTGLGYREAGYHYQPLSTSDLSNGTYYITLRTADKSQTQKIIVSK